jgi:hypothetical protein
MEDQPYVYPSNDFAALGDEYSMICGKVGDAFSHDFPGHRIAKVGAKCGEALGVVWPGFAD